ncbi:hypothetical protein [Actinoplanes sp. NPDC049118]
MLFLLDPDWDHTVRRATDSIEEAVDLVYAWLRDPPAYPRQARSAQ